MMTLRCSACNINFNDKGSLEVHYSYNHSHFLPDEVKAEEPDAEPATHNNHQPFFKYYHQNPPDNNHEESSSVMTAISPGHAGSRNFELQQPVAAAQHSPANRLYDMSPPSSQQQQQQHHHHNDYKPYLMNSPQDYLPGSPVAVQNGNTAGDGYSFNEQRYHPYYKHQPSSFRPMDEPTPLRCEKCHMQCASQEALQHHIALAHGAFPAGPHLFGSLFTNGPPLNGGAGEPQAEILDLDSHKVHVYQPPNGEDSEDSDHNSLDPWGREDSKFYHQQLQNVKVEPGPGTTLSPSPDRTFYQQQLQNIKLEAGAGSIPSPSPNRTFYHQQLQNVKLEAGVDSNPSPSPDRKFYHQQLQNVKAEPGAGSTPSPSADFDSVSTTTANIETLQSSTRSPYYKHDSSDVSGANSTRAQISSSEHNGSAAKSSSSKAAGGKSSNEARRPKTYNCSACTKWFTSSGHLKRHYNTTMHKNAVKQSGAIDPATLPISTHHHPQRADSPYPSSRQANGSPPDEPATSPPTQPAIEATAAAYRHSQPHLPSTFMHHHPNLMAGPPEAAGGLLHSSYTPSQADLKAPSPTTTLHSRQQQVPPHSNHTSYLGFAPPATQAPFFHQLSPTPLYPNFQSPHVSTTHQVTTNSLTGKLTDDSVLAGACSTPVGDATDSSKLPSFACIQKNNLAAWNAEQFLSTLDDNNVGGQFSSSDEENATTAGLSTNFEAEVKDKPEEEQPQPLLQEDAKVSSSTEPTCSSTPPFSCGECSKFFNKSCYLTQHNKSFHSGYKPFKCVRCGKRFLDNLQYKTHADKHAGDKPYKCEICPKAFNHKTDLRRHTCLHSDVRPYNCDICQKGFIRKDHMVKHRDTHQNRKGAQRKFKVATLKKELEFMQVTC